MVANGAFDHEERKKARVVAEDIQPRKNKESELAARSEEHRTTKTQQGLIFNRYGSTVSGTTILILVVITIPVPKPVIITPIPGPTTTCAQSWASFWWAFSRADWCVSLSASWQPQMAGPDIAHSHSRHSRLYRSRDYHMGRDSPNRWRQWGNFKLRELSNDYIIITRRTHRDATVAVPRI
ncbi:hypothetical protein EDB84DRAFT_1446906 [Lactarius hengduanensis]|nr:hypothetical protein EDB84DRAFT_1446906 [Lactarius hengduanensis]